MIHFVPTVVFDFPSTVNKLRRAVALEEACSRRFGRHLCRRRLSSAAAGMASCVRARRDARSILLGLYSKDRGRPKLDFKTFNLNHREPTSRARTDRTRLGHNVDESAVLCVRRIKAIALKA